VSTRRRRRKPKPHRTGGSARHPASLANLRHGNPSATNQQVAALRHGAFATIPRSQLDAEVAEIYRAFADSAPVRAEDGSLPLADEAAVEVAARALKRWRHVVLWCDTYGRFDEKTGEKKPAADYELDCERALKRALADLGLDPTARAKLGLDLQRATSLDLAMHWAEEDGAVEGAAEEVDDDPQA
jgi:phage terminase small subunit